MVSFDDFKKLDIRVGKILAADPVEGSDKLLKLFVDLGEGENRQIIAGIRIYREPHTLVGMQCAFVANLEPRTILGLESNGMLLAANSGEALSLLLVDENIPPGTAVH